MKLNFNTQATVTLTSKGAEIYNKWAESFPPMVRPTLVSSGVALTHPLWQLFQIFGGADNIFMGMTEVPFVGNVITLKGAE